MRGGSTSAPPLDPFAPFNGPCGTAAIQAALNALSPGGTYHLPQEIFTLGPITINQANLNLVAPPGGTIIHGCMQFTPRALQVSDPGYAQINSSVRASVQVIDMGAAGVLGKDLTNFGPWGSGGNNVVSLAEPQLISDNTPYVLSQWPTPSSLTAPTTFSTTTGFSGYVSITDSTLPSWSSANWTGNNRVISRIYPTSYTESVDYYSSATISSKTITFDTAIPGSYGTMGSSCRHFVQNVLEQLLIAGQYYFDYNNALIYFIPLDTLPHKWRVTMAQQDLFQIASGGGGLTISGGPLLLHGGRANGMSSTSNVSNVTLGNIQAIGCGMDAFLFPYAHSGWSCTSLLAQYSGGAGLFFGPYNGYSGSGSSVTPPLLTAQSSNFATLSFTKNCQRTRTYRGDLHTNVVGCNFGATGGITSFGNPNHVVIHDCHNTNFDNLIADWTLVEGGDVGVVYSQGDPTQFGVVFNSPQGQNCPGFTSPKSAPNNRRGIYVDNLSGGITINNAVALNWNAASGNTNEFIYLSGGQANVVNGISMYNCSSQPVNMDYRGSSAYAGSPQLASWWQSTGVCYYLVTNANNLSGAPYSVYGTPWTQLLTGTGVQTGAPRNCAIQNVAIASSCTASQVDYRTTISSNTNVTLTQPQGAVSPGQGTLGPIAIPPASPTSPIYQ